MYRKEIIYDRETRDFRMELNGELIGFARTYHEAEITLDQTAYELLTAGHFATATELDGGAVEMPDAYTQAADAGAFGPQAPAWDINNEDCDDHGPYADDECPKCSCGTCIQNATHNVNGVHCCCFHYSEELTGVLCGCTDDDYSDAMAEQAMGTYNGNTWSGAALMPEGDWLDVEGMRVVAPTGGMVVVQIAPEAPESLREDCLNVITQALNNRPAKDMIPELRRIKLRLEAAGMSRVVALD